MNPGMWFNDCLTEILSVYIPKLLAIDTIKHDSYQFLTEFDTLINLVWLCPCLIVSSGLRYRNPRTHPNLIRDEMVVNSSTCQRSLLREIALFLNCPVSKFSLADALSLPFFDSTILYLFYRIEAGRYLQY